MEQKEIIIQKKKELDIIERKIDKRLKDIEKLQVQKHLKLCRKQKSLMF